jgi:hypothetical protein
MKKYQTIIGCLLIAIALYFGLSSIDIDIEVKNTSSPQSIQEKLIQEKFQAYQDWGYYNGLAMPKRILSENEWFKKTGDNNYDPNLTCEQLIDEMYDIGYKNANRPD